MNNRCQKICKYSILINVFKYLYLNMFYNALLACNTICCTETETQDVLCSFFQINFIYL